MFELFMMGGVLFMSLVTFAFIGAIVVAVKSLINIMSGEVNDSTFQQLGYVKSAGLLALVIGVLGQMIGLYSAFSSIEQMGSVSPAMLAGGLKVSSITTMWGLMCYVLSLIIFLVLSAMAKNKQQQ